MDKSSNVVIYNHLLEFKIQLIGVVSLLSFVLLGGEVSAWFMIGIIPSASLLFPTAGSVLNKENRSITEFIIILLFKFRKTYAIDLSYELFLSETQNSGKPIFTNPLKKSKNYSTQEFCLTLESKNASKCLYFLYDNIDEAIQAGIELSQALSIKFTKVLDKI